MGGQMPNEVSMCCDEPLVYHIYQMKDGSIGYEPWDYCPACLKICDGYNPREQEITKGANNDTIKRALERLSKEYGYGRKDNVIDSENDSVCDGLLYGPKKCSS